MTIEEVQEHVQIEKKLGQVLNAVKRIVIERGKKTCPIGHATHEALLDEFIREVVDKVK
ncbi:MAG: hypothetical protein ACREDF_04105 [Thermoplasmata archaeon]